MNISDIESWASSIVLEIGDLIADEVGNDAIEARVKELIIDLFHRQPHVRSLGFFRNDRERYLRRDVIDTFLRGNPVDEKELREAVSYLLMFALEVRSSRSEPKPPRRRNPLLPRKPPPSVGRRSVG